MAYYTALINAWNSVTQPPAGVTGAALSGGDTTLQKIAKVNAWTVVGSALTPNIPVTNIIGAIVTDDFLALTALQLQQLQFLLQSSDMVYAPIDGTVRNVFATIFATKPTTLANLTALVTLYDAPQVPWWSATVAQGGGQLNGLVSLTDTVAVGLN